MTPDELLALAIADAEKRTAGRTRIDTSRAPGCVCDNMDQTVRERAFLKQCGLCTEWQFNPVKRAQWSGQKPAETVAAPNPKVCPFLGDVLKNADDTTKTRLCGTCKNFPNKVVSQCLHPEIGPTHNGEVTILECSVCPQMKAIIAQPVVSTKEKVILVCHLAAGDSCINTVVLDALHSQYPDRFETYVIGTYARAVFANNPQAKCLPKRIERAYNAHRKRTGKNPPFQLGDFKVLHFCQPPDTKHISHSVCEYLGQNLGIELKTPASTKPIFYLGKQEKYQELFPWPYVIINAGWTAAMETKWYARWQEVVDKLRRLHPYLTFVQVGRKTDAHPLLKGVVDMRGRWDKPDQTRKFMTAVSRAKFAMGPESFLAYLCSGFDVPYFCILSGLIPLSRIEVPGIVYLNQSDGLSCCPPQGCGKSKWGTCTNMLAERHPKCMDILPDQIVQAVLAHVPSLRGGYQC